MPYLNTDIPELKGFDTGLCLSNLELLEIRRDRVSESMLAVLSELCNAILQDAEGDPDTVDSILLSLQGSPDGEESVSLPHVAAVNREWLTLTNTHAGLYARLFLWVF